MAYLQFCVGPSLLYASCFFLPTRLLAYAFLIKPLPLIRLLVFIIVMFVRVLLAELFLLFICLSYSRASFLIKTFLSKCPWHVRLFFFFCDFGVAVNYLLYASSFLVIKAL